MGARRGSRTQLVHDCRMHVELVELSSVRIGVCRIRQRIGCLGISFGSIHQRIGSFGIGISCIR